jgi:hypothetical protein
MDHGVIDQRSLAMAAIIARRIRENPRLLEVADENLDRWLAICAPNSRPALMEWKGILKRGLDETLKTLCTEDERSTRLRQSSPFAGEEFITRAERTDLILRSWGKHPAN